jgi:hypothetical protein
MVLAAGAGERLIERCGSVFNINSENNKSCDVAVAALCLYGAHGALCCALCQYETSACGCPPLNPYTLTGDDFRSCLSVNEYSPATPW